MKDCPTGTFCLYGRTGTCGATLMQSVLVRLDDKAFWVQFPVGQRLNLRTLTHYQYIIVTRAANPWCYLTPISL